MSNIHCKTCGAPIEDKEMDRGRGLARCRYCDTVVELDPKTFQPRVAPKSFYEREAVPMPMRFTVEGRGGSLVIQWSWLTLKSALVLFVALGWDGFLVVHYAEAMGLTLVDEWHDPGAADAAVQNAELFVPLLHVAMGLVLTYIGLASLLNTTTLTVSRNYLDVKHAPLPWLGNGPVDGIRQLFSKERVHRGRHGSKSYSYELHAVLRDSSRKKIVGRLEEASQALWLEQAIEEHLNIEDKPIGGEIPRR